MEEKTILIINAIVNKENMAEVKSYLGKIMPIFMQNGGKPLGRYKTVQQLLGDDNPEMVAIIEFPNAETIKEMVNGDSFNALAESRAKAFTKLNMVVSTEM